MKHAWLQCRAKPLSAEELQLLTKFNSIGGVSLAFTERVMKEYKSLQRSSLHLNAKNIFTGAIGQVVKQVRPASDVPDGGDVPTLFAKLFPVAVKVFGIQASDPRDAGSDNKEWIQKLIDDNTYTYHDCAKYEKVCSLTLILNLF